ncbi:Chaperone NapD [Paraburkholderia caffeinitolerans]|uniref:Chaperone NapD n=1 Tax=Paraburkholderia caffeinitolerans TaxID=1723730 RepID=A0A6J5FJI5_9BURK|nr:MULTISPECIES: chaperone NapD [Paraburkholderia]CAB3778967.1 Chaperone NapD [Paraburkholderia caffeinitolerans]
MSVETRSATCEKVTSNEFHVAGVVIYAQSDRCESISQSLGMLPGAQVHVATPDGRMVVTLEGAHSLAIEEQLSAINALPGVHASALVYQHHENIESPE